MSLEVVRNGRALVAFDDEIDRARRLFPNQEATLTMAEWLAVLVEEVGEVGKEINDAARGDRFTSVQLARLSGELVQVGAMAARMWYASERRRP